jgi:hypothetical protein
MRFLRRFQAVAVVVLLAGVVAGQQIPTGTLTGHVTDRTAPLPGVTVTVTSPNQQGARLAYSTVNGAYILLQLPPGLYTVRFELQGFETVETTVKISGDLTSRVDAVMPRVTTVAEEITVTGRYDTVSTTATNAATYESKLIQVLPVSRDVSGYVDLTPGTVVLGVAPRYETEITGAATSENLNLINGATATDNYWGYLLPLFIEDAIQETTTSVSGVSAEYGRFTGGVVSALTKSGGNEFHGSLRLNLSNPKWTAPTPLTIERTDKLDTVWEGTLGGYILKDKLWFFLGGRTGTTTSSQQTSPPVSIPYDSTTRQDRYEGKLTFALSPNHRLIGSYLDVAETLENGGWGYDLETLYTKRAPENIMVLNYSGALSNTLSLEAQYSAQKKTYKDLGSRYTDIERGTPVKDMLNWGLGYNSPWLCAVCPDPDDHRDNSDAFAKASVFISTENAGSHDLRFGVDLFDNMVKYNGWQTGSGYALDASRVKIVGTGTDAKYYPVILPGDSYLEYYPMFEMSKGSHFKTQSPFVNDVWRLGNHFSFNIGVRYDRNDGIDASGTKVVTDVKWSPRLSVTWDPKGDGATQVTLGYGEYVGAITTLFANGQAIGGQTATITLWYDGPPINAEGNDVETHEALRQVFAWLDGIGGPMANPQLWGPNPPSVPGYQTFIGDNLKSPSTAEWTAGIAQRLGTRGLIRLDYINKVWSDFYSYRTDLTTGTSEDPFGNVYDRTVLENDNTFTHRKYWGLILQGDYRFGDHLQVGGNYTYSKLYGNDGGYAVPYPSDALMYPEYHDVRWYSPGGYLAGDRRHKLNLYASWDAVNAKAFAWNLSLLQRYLSGAPYGAWSGSVLVGPYVKNPGYVHPPEFIRYNFTAPDAYRTDAVSSTDLAMTFTFKLAGLELYVNARVTNLFNNQAAPYSDQMVYVKFDLPDNLAPFNPFTDKPKECPQGTTCNLADGYNWQKDPNFGKPIVPDAYQTTRTFLLNVGLRF